MDYETYIPPVDKVFNANRPATSTDAGCTVDGANSTQECSCTQSAGPSKGYYWSSSTYTSQSARSAPGSILAWGVLFGDGDVRSVGKSDHDYIRAVRCGLVSSDIR